MSLGLGVTARIAAAAAEVTPFIGPAAMRVGGYAAAGGISQSGSI